MRWDKSLALWRRHTRPVESNFAYYIDGRCLQALFIVVRNSGGVLQHAFTSNGDGTGTPSTFWTHKFRNIAPLSAFTNTPTLGAGQGFVGGAGFNNHLLVFDTVPIRLDGPRPMDHVELTYYTGNNARGRPIAGLRSVNVLGNSNDKFCIGMWNAATGAALTWNTTWLPTGTQALIQYFGYL